MVVTWADVDHQIVRAQRSYAREPPTLSTCSQLKRRLDRVVRSRQERQPREARRYERLFQLLRCVIVGRLCMGGNAELGVHVRARRIEVHQDDRLTELRKIHSEI